VQNIFKTIIKNTPYGPIALLWSYPDKGLQIIKVIISKPGSPADKKITALFPEIISSSCTAVDNICFKIEAYLSGENINFSLELPQLQNCTIFQQTVLRANHTILRGKVCSYSFLATRIENPEASRAIGTALATNPFPILIPCHRVIRSDRSLGGFGGGLKMKRTLLEMEGVSFDKTGRVYRHHLDQVLTN